MSIDPRKIEITVDDLCVENSHIIIENPDKGSSLILRKFQQEVVEFMKSVKRYLLLEAPTGSGKTFTILAPLISNTMYGTKYNGIVGIYPTKPLTVDQFISLRGILDKLGTRIYERKGIDGGDVVIIYDINLVVKDKQGNKVYRDKKRVALIRLTRDVLDKLAEAVVKEVSEGKKKVSRITLFNMIREVLLEYDVDYIITVAVPEYPYLMMSSLYRSFPDSGKLLSLVAEGGLAYRIAKKIVELNGNELYQEIDRIVRMLYKVVSSRVWERGLADIMAALFPEILFLDEFHTWNVYEKPTILSLILLHYMISKLSLEQRKYKVIFSSATPQDDIVKFIKSASIGEVIKVRAKTVKCSSNNASGKIRSKTVVEFYPVVTKPESGIIAWLQLDEALPSIVQNKIGEMRKKGRAIVFGRRVATVEESASVFYKETGIPPIVVTGVKPKQPFLGKDALPERRKSGELHLFGNYSIELGIDLANIRYGIVIGSYHGEIVQRFGRIGRGEVKDVKIIIPCPIGYIYYLKEKIKKHGSLVNYWVFVNNILSTIVPRRLSITAIGTRAILHHRIGKLRVYLPLASFMLVQIFRMKDKPEDLKEVCSEFIRVVNALKIKRIFKWLSVKVSKNSEVLTHIASFRITLTIPYIREEELNELIDESKLPEHSIMTLLANYEVKLRRGKYGRLMLILGKPKKKRIAKLAEFPLISLTKENTLLSSFFGNVMSSNVLFSCLRGRKRGIVLQYLSHDAKILYQILQEYNIPIYIAKPLEKRNSLLDILQAYGYAIRFESSGEPQAYLLML